MPELLNYASAPPKRWAGVVLWTSGVLAFGIFGLILFSYLTGRNTGSAVPTATETILRGGPLWFIYPYQAFITRAWGERGFAFVVLEVFALYPLYAVLFGFAAYRGRARRLLVILLILHLVLGVLGIAFFIAKDIAFHANYGP